MRKLISSQESEERNNMAKTIKDIAEALRVEPVDALKVIKSLSPRFKDLTINTEIDGKTRMNFSSQIALAISKVEIPTKHSKINSVLNKEQKTSETLKGEINRDSSNANESNSTSKKDIKLNSLQTFSPNQKQGEHPEKTELPGWKKHEINTRFNLDKKFPFCTLSNVLLFDAQKVRLATDYEPNSWKSDNAIEVDHLLHQTLGDVDRLFIIECKNQPIIVGRGEWFVEYDGKRNEISWNLKRKYEALENYVNPIGRGRHLKVEIIVVTSNQQESLRELISSKVNRHIVFIKNLISYLQINFPDPFLKVGQSDILNIVRLGIPVPETGHPELSNAITYIERTRRSIDNEIYQIFNPTDSRWAVNGSAGMGKSVLLAYSLCVFCSNRSIIIDEQGVKKLTDFTGKAENLKIPPHGQRKVYAYALKEKQKEVISALYRRFADEFMQLTEEKELSFGRPIINIWQGKVPDDCHVLLIDEAHDLSDKDAEYLENWIRDNNRYLLIACDRHQKLSLCGQDAAIIKGISFSRKTKKLRLNYRNPFPVYTASIGLMFRWFAATGPKVIPSKDQLKNGFGFEVNDQDQEKLVLSMKNDSHPGNRWSNCVEVFSSPQSAFTRLKNYGFKQKDVLWVRFSDENEAFDYEQLSNFTYHNLNCDESVDLADKYIKGQDFPIVVIEGMSDQMCSDQKEDELKMWQRRRELYICCSRATAFLFLIAPREEIQRTTAKNEYESIANQLSTPVRNTAGSYFNWQFSVPCPNDDQKRCMDVFSDTEDRDTEDFVHKA